MWTGTFSSDFYPRFIVGGNIDADETHVTLTYTGTFKYGKMKTFPQSLRPEIGALMDFRMGYQQRVIFTLTYVTENTITGTYQSFNPMDSGTFRLTQTN